EAEPARLAQQSRSFLGQRLVEIAELGACLEPAHELGRGGNPHVGGDQRLLPPLPRRPLRRIECGRGDLLGQRPAALAERVAQTREEATGLGARLRIAAVSVAEQLRPRAAHACETRFRIRSLRRCEAGSRWSATIAAAPAAI